MSSPGTINLKDLFLNGIVKENTIFKLALSLCPSIAVTNNLKNGVFMGLAVLFVQVMVKEMFASKNKILPSMVDGLGMGVGFLFALTVISFFRELVGKATLTIPTGLNTTYVATFMNTKPLLIMVLPAGGFLAVGILMALFNWIDAKYKKNAHGTH